MCWILILDVMVFKISGKVHMASFLLACGLGNSSENMGMCQIISFSASCKILFTFSRSRRDDDVKNRLNNA